MRLKSFRNAIIQILLEKQKGQCAVCDGDLSMGVLAVQFENDPEREGGKEEIGNMDLVHRFCINRGRGHKERIRASRLKKEGKTPQEIATILKKSLRMVYNYLRKEREDAAPAPEEVEAESGFEIQPSYDDFDP